MRHRHAPWDKARASDRPRRPLTTRTPPDPQSLEMAAKRLWQNFELQLTIDWFGEAAKSVDESSSLTGAPGDNSTAALAAAIAATGEIPPTS